MQPVEKRIITALIERLESAGYVPTQYYDSVPGDGEYQEVTGATLPERIASALAAVDSTDCGTLHFSPNEDGVFFVLGNGIDVISDYHCGDPKFDAVVSAVSDESESFL